MNKVLSDGKTIAFHIVTVPGVQTKIRILTTQSELITECFQYNPQRSISIVKPADVIRKTCAISIVVH